MKHKKSILVMFLIPLLCISLLQGVLPFWILYLLNVKSTLEQNTVKMDRQIIVNRQVVLQNTMIENWSAISDTTDSMNTALSRVLAQNDATVEDFLEDKYLQQEYLKVIFPEMLEHVEDTYTCGGFVVLANNEPVEEAAMYRGFFLRDSDPTTKSATANDIILERGDKSLARLINIPMDSAWNSTFHFLGEGNRQADNFFYQPYLAAKENNKVDMKNLGYWSEPFVLEDHYLDNHKMITYSIPLVYDDVVYGVLGTEISLAYFSTFFSARDLDLNSNAGYAVGILCEDGTYEMVVGSGALSDSVTRDTQKFSVTKSKIDDLYLVNDVEIGDQKIYTMMSDLSLYGNNVPYKRTQWVLCGFATEESIFGMGKLIYERLLSAIIVGAGIGVVAILVIVRTLTNPVKRLVASVQGGVEGLKKFTPSNILEVDELHDVIQTLSETEQKNAYQIQEEKERYRIAIESSSDVFYTYYFDAQTIEIVNSFDKDGIWNLSETSGVYKNAQNTSKEFLHFMDELKKRPMNIDMEMMLLNPVNKNLEWYHILGNTIVDADGNREKIVGSIRNIHEEKVEELEQKLKEELDPVTSFYRMEPGMQHLAKRRELQPNGIAFVLDIASFSSINEAYGLTFGDVLLQEISELLISHFQNPEKTRTLFIRLGADEIFAWLANANRQDVIDELDTLEEEVSSLVHFDFLHLHFHAGIVEGTSNHTEDDLLDYAGKALEKARDHECAAELFDGSESIESTSASSGFSKHEYSDIISLGYPEKMELASLALNLFDRNGNMRAALDLLSLRLAKTYGITNLVITSFHHDYYVNSVNYYWKAYDGVDRNSVARVTESEYQNFWKNAVSKSIQPVSTELMDGQMFNNLFYCSKGVVLHMTDNGVYSGSIFMIGMSPDVLEVENIKKSLKEIGTVIQNRINQEHHDQSAQAKSDFLARMSHEIRTPMNGIIGMTEIALKPGQTEDRRIDCLQKVRSSSQYLLGLINDILDMSKIESGKMQINNESFSMYELADGLHSLLDTKFDEKNQTFLCNLEIKHEFFVGDMLRLNQVLINLLGNANKFTEPKKTVSLHIKEVEISETHSYVMFEVKDEGIGISEEDQKRVFQSFEQAGNETSSRRGTGLGLAISSRLVRLMGNEIILKSELGKGSTFSFILDMPLGKDLKQEEKIDAVDLHFNGAHVLVAEDNELNAEIITTILNDYDLSVDLAEDGAIAVDMFKASPQGYYQLVLMDIMMPNMNGFEATKTIRSLDREDSKSVAIVAMSANAFDEDEKRSIQAGMNAHLSKPINMERLQKMLVSVFKK